MGAAKKIGGPPGRGMIYFGARIPKSTRDALERYAGRRRLSASAAAAQLLEEGLRMEQFPGIDFRWTPSGRKAYVTGTGLSAWEMHLLWDSHGRSVEKVRKNYPHLTTAQVRAGSAYVEGYPEEKPSFEPPPFAKVVKV